MRFTEVSRMRYCSYCLHNYCNRNSYEEKKEKFNLHSIENSHGLKSIEPLFIDGYRMFNVFPFLTFQF